MTPILADILASTSPIEQSFHGISTRTRDGSTPLESADSLGFESELAAVAVPFQDRGGPGNLSSLKNASIQAGLLTEGRGLPVKGKALPDTPAPVPLAPATALAVREVSETLRSAPLDAVQLKPASEHEGLRPEHHAQRLQEAEDRSSVEEPNDRFRPVYALPSQSEETAMIGAGAKPSETPARPDATDGNSEHPDRPASLGRANEFALRSGPQIRETSIAPQNGAAVSTKPISNDAPVVTQAKPAPQPASQPKPNAEAQASGHGSKLDSSAQHRPDNLQTDAGLQDAPPAPRQHPRVTEGAAQNRGNHGSRDVNIAKPAVIAAGLANTVPVEAKGVIRANARQPHDDKASPSTAQRTSGVPKASPMPQAVEQQAPQIASALSPNAPAISAPAPVAVAPPISVTAPQVPVDPTAEPRIAAHLESAVEQLAETRQATRSARPEILMRHAEFGLVNMRLDASSGDLRATLAARDPGFVPAVQSALAERVVAAGNESMASNGQRGGEAASQSSGQALGNGFAQNYGSSTGSSQGSPQPRMPHHDGDGRELDRTQDQAPHHEAADKRQSGVFA